MKIYIISIVITIAIFLCSLRCSVSEEYIMGPIMSVCCTFQLDPLRPPP